MRLQRTLLGILLGLSVLTAGRAQAAEFLQLSAFGAFNFAKPRIDPSVDVSSKLGLGFGALAYFPLFPLVSLESGLIYLPTRFSINGNDVSLNHVQIPVVLRLNPLPFISVGGGFYYALALGSVNQTTGNVTTTYTYDQLNYSTSDVGLVLSGALELSVAPFTSLLVDLRYLLGLKNIDGNGSTKLGGILILTGLKFGL